ARAAAPGRAPRRPRARSAASAPRPAPAWHAPPRPAPPGAALPSQGESPWSPSSASPRATAHARGGARRGALFRRPDRPARIADRHAHRVAVFGPRAVVVAHVVAQELLQREPGVAGALADAAVGDDGPAAVDAHGA